MRRVLLLFIILIILGPGSPDIHPAFAQRSVIAVMESAKRAVVDVHIHIYDIYREKPRIAGIDRANGRLAILRGIKRADFYRDGAGVILRSSGIIVTNAHTVYRADTVTVTLHDKTVLPAKIVKFVNNLDLALLKVDPPHPLATVTLANSNDVHLGENVFTIGHSKLLNQSVSGGRIIGVGRSRHGRSQRNELFETTLNIYHGDSGGPLFDEKGRLIGLLTARENSANQPSFAIPSNEIARELTQYLKNHPITTVH